MKRCTVFVFSILPLLVSSYYMKIGILSHDLDPETTKKVWSMAQNYSTMMSLEPIVQMSQRWDIDNAAQVSRSICSLMKRGVDALVYLGPPRWNAFVSSYATRQGLPFLAALENSDFHYQGQEACMLPDTTEAAAKFLAHYGWDSFFFFYDSDNGPDQLQKVLLSLLSVESVPRIDGFWKADSPELALRYFEEVSDSPMKRVLLATSEEFADVFARLARRCDVLLLTPVGTVRQTPHQGMNTLTKFSVVDAENPVLTTLENRLRTLSSFSARGRPGKDVPDSAILHYDSSKTLDTMFNLIARENPSALRSRTHLDCLQFSDQDPGTSDFLRKVSVEHGATGKIKFDDLGRRVDYKLNVVQSSPYGIHNIGTWSDWYGLQMSRDTTRTAAVPAYAAYRNDDPLIVTSVLVEPFLRLNENGSFEGFVVDFLDELSKEINLQFRLQVVKDGRYGVIVNGQWAGMIGELVRGEAQLAVAPLTKTLQRQSVVHFSKNIFTTGLNVLMLKRKDSDYMQGSAFAPFAFLGVWSPDTWVVVVLVVALFSAGSYGISRFVGVPDRVRALESKSTDNLSPCGSVWFTVGSLFCRDTGIYPRNLTHRLWALLWWIFCIFISLLYVSMLTSSLIKVRTTITTTHSRKTSQDVLKEFLETGYPVLGTIRGGSTMSLFQNSQVGLYQQYGQYLKDNPDVMVASYSEGVERVRKSDGKYALITESASSELIANTEPCDTLVTSGHLFARNYAVALPKNSTLKEIIDHGILSIIETGRLRSLYEKWWHNQPSSCEDPNLNILPNVYNTSMTLRELSGIFYLFILFSLLSIAVAAVEYYIRTRNIVVK